MTNSQPNIEATVVNQRTSPKFYLKGESAQVADKVFPLTSNTKFGSTTLGRDKECHIIVNEPGVSRRHAAFHVEEGAVWLEDLNSANGTFVNKVSISKQELYPGDLIAFDKVQFRLEVLGEVLRPAKARTASVAGSAAGKTAAVTPPANKKSWSRWLLLLLLLALAGAVGYGLRSFG